MFIASKLHLFNIQFLSGQIDCPPDFVEPNEIRFAYNLEYGMGFNLDEKLVKTELNVSFESDTKGQNLKEASGKFGFSFMFLVENLEELATKDEENIINLDPGLASSLASLTYSTVRGLLFTRLQGTAFKNFILPVIDPSELLKRDEVEQKKKDNPKRKPKAKKVL